MFDYYFLFFGEAAAAFLLGEEEAPPLDADFAVFGFGALGFFVGPP